MGKLNTKSDHIITVIQCSIKSNPDEFQKWIKDRASKYVFELKEENTISYEWHLSDDNKDATLVEAFVNSDSAVQRFKNHAKSPIASEVLEHVNITSVYCFGNANNDLVDILSAWGAKIQRHYCGFNHR